MEQNVDVNGASCTSVLMLRHCRCGLSCVTSNNVTDAAVVPQLLAQLPTDEPLLSVTGDGAYDTQPVYAAVMGCNAMPIIPPRKNARMRKGAAFVHRNAAIAACQRFGRKLWKSWSGYHRRSLVETKMY